MPSPNPPSPFVSILWVVVLTLSAAISLVSPGLALDYAAIEARAIKAVESADQKELVRPTPKGFKKSSKRREVRLALVPRARVINVGQSFWYRLELQNTGQEELEIEETPSFLKDGSSYSAQKWEFYATGPDGKRKEMILGTLADELLGSMRETAPDKALLPRPLTAVQREELDVEEAARRKAANRLRVSLRPGETLLSRPWRWLTSLEYSRRKSRGESIIWPRPDEPFRELWTVYSFRTPGKYVIEAEYVDEPLPPPDEEYLRAMEKEGVPSERVQRMHRRLNSKSLGRFRSNKVQIEVLP